MKTLTFKVIIPARMRSTRLPGKMLADIAGKPMVAWVAERAADSGAEDVIIATDHADIADAMAALDWRVCTTSTAHATGTDRLAEAVDLLELADSEIVVNVQGDEPLIDPRLVREVARELALRPKASIATAVHPISSAKAFFDPNVVKVVHDTDGYATYFSRAPIPYARDAFALSRKRLPADFPAFRHIGIYAYRVSYLRKYASAPWGTGTASRSPSGPSRSSPASTRARTSSACASCSLPGPPSTPGFPGFDPVRPARR